MLKSIMKDPVVTGIISGLTVLVGFKGPEALQNFQSSQLDEKLNIERMVERNTKPIEIIRSRYSHEIIEPDNGTRVIEGEYNGKTGKYVETLTEDVSKTIIENNKEEDIKDKVFESTTAYDTDKKQYMLTFHGWDKKQAIYEAIKNKFGSIESVTLRGISIDGKYLCALIIRDNWKEQEILKVVQDTLEGGKGTLGRELTQEEKKSNLNIKSIDFVRSKALELSVRNQEEEIKNITFNINVQKSFLPLGLAGVVGVTVTAYLKRKKSDTPPSF